MNKTNLIIKKYNSDCEEFWDKFVENGIFGTIYHTRKFINYHPPNRFIDESIMMYYKNELVCVLSCCRKGDGYFSYTGSTYGGPVFLKKYCKTNYIKQIIDKIFEYYDNKIEFRLANNIYFEESTFSLYYLLSIKLKIIPELSYYVKTNDDFLTKIKNKRNKKYLLKMINDHNLLCYKTNNKNDYIDFYKILTKNLKTNHNNTPTHTLDEFLLIKELLSDKQLLYIVKDSRYNILGGVYLIKVTNVCWYTFYISKNIDFNEQNVSIMYIMYTISNDAKNENIKYIDYGICTENQGTTLNQGLSDYKENSLGGICNCRYLFLK